VWHASIGPSGADSRLIALRVLHGVGDPIAGEWFEVGVVADHVRRRLTEGEAAIVGPVCDVRGTVDAATRFARMRPFLPPGWTEVQ
jgi:hypothetical protein